MKAFACNEFDLYHSLVFECDCQTCRDNRCMQICGDGEANDDMLFWGDGYCVASLGVWDNRGVSTENTCEPHHTDGDGIGRGLEGESLGDGHGTELSECEYL